MSDFATSPGIKLPCSRWKQCGFYVRHEVWSRFRDLAEYRGSTVGEQAEKLIRDWYQDRYPISDEYRVGHSPRVRVSIRLPRDLYNTFQNLAYKAGCRSASDCLDKLLSMVFDIPIEYHRALGRPRKDGLEPGDRPLESIEDIPIEMRTDLTREEKDRRIWSLMRQY